MNHSLNPWADVMLGQLLMCRWAVDVGVKTCNPQNWVDLDAVSDAAYRPSEPRLNPLEFHGQRRSLAVQRRANAAGKPRVRSSNRNHQRV